MKKLAGRILLFLFAAPLVVLALGLLWPFLLVEHLRERAWRRRHAGAVLLVCSSRRGWHDFVVNNLIPALPAGTEVRWWRPVRGGLEPRWLSRLYGAGIFGVPKPFLVLVTRRKLRHRSLNVDLQTEKAHAARSAEVRRACAAVVERAIAGLRKRG